MKISEVESGYVRVRNELKDVVRALREAGVSVAVAESCTGGGLGYTLTSVPGSSAFFAGGVIAYANAVKVKVLGVRERVLARHGAVSRAVACAMARGVRKLLGAGYGVGITGIAGPTGGTPTKPVGTVWIAVAGPRVRARVKCYHFSGGRAHIRRAAIAAALRMLNEALDASTE